MRYEFPQSQNRYDANWLMIRTRLVFRQQEFSDVSPSLEAGDIIRIAVWLEDLSNRRLPECVCLGFTEPNLRFEIFRATDDFVCIGVRMSLESQPPFKTGGIRDETVCQFQLSDAQLDAHAQQFRAIADNFPVRQLSQGETPAKRPAKGMEPQFAAHALGQMRRRFGTKGSRPFH